MDFAEDGLMSTEEAFLAEIIDHPKDDTPRLIYADWLEEHGQGERGEFIRVQCELVKLPPPRKRYTIVDTFVSRRGKGVCCVEGDPVEVGDRLDLVLPVEERHGLYKEKWHGVLVTSLHGPGVRYGGRIRTGFDFLVDEQSRPWPGEALHSRELELLGAHGEEWVRPIAVILGLERWGNAGITCGPGDPRSSTGWTFRCGFVHAVSLKWEDWCGTECRRCQGQGWVGKPRHVQAFDLSGAQCFCCHGAGRTGAHGPSLVKAAPLEKVILTDREPYYSAPMFNAGQERFVWFSANPSTAKSHLGVDLFSFLKGGYRRNNDQVAENNHVAEYPSLEATSDALSEACLEMAKSTPSAK